VQIARDLSVQLAIFLGQPLPGVNPDTVLLSLDWRFVKKWTLSSTLGDQGTTIFDLLWQKRRAVLDARAPLTQRSVVVVGVMPVAYVSVARTEVRQRRAGGELGAAAMREVIRGPGADRPWPTRGTHGAQLSFAGA
jgi:hypothetical protein